jgi:probable O-glycosylation ligase (exosortase A-associated)
MRDIALTLFVLGALPACVKRPWLGILMWCWFAFMAPQSHTWGFAATLPFSLLVAMATFLGLVTTRDKQPFLWRAETILIVVLWLWFTATTVVAIYPADSWPYWWRTTKMLLMALLTIPLFQSRERLRWLLLVIAVSLGYYGARGGLFVFLTGGNSMVMGAGEGTSISSNNAVGLALNMSLPVFWYLAREEPRRWWRYGLYATFALSIVAVPFTYSRGALLGLGVVLALLALKAKLRYLPLLGVGLAIAAVLLFTFAPDKFTRRVETIERYEEDGSANARLAAWSLGLELAKDRPITGGGFWVYNHLEIWQRYAPPEWKDKFYDAHSLYFNLLGDHGFVGLGLFLLLVATVLWRLRGVHRQVRGRPDLAWASRYAHMLEVTIIGYLVTGAFMSVSYFDFAYTSFVIAILVSHLAGRPVAVTADAADVAFRRPARALPASPESA